MNRKILTATVFALLTALAVNAEEIPYEEYPDFVTFMNMYNRTLYSSHDKLILMNKPHKLQKLGKEKKDGDISGTISYKTKIVGFSGVVTMEYTDYSDFEGWILNGFSNTKANMNASGKMFGTVNVSGDYNAKVSYDNLKIKKGNAGGGFYTVEYGDGRKGKVEWNEIDQTIIPINDADEQVDMKDLEDK